MSAILGAAMLGAACGGLRADLPVGTFQSVQPIEDRLCVAVETERASCAEEASLRAWWWDQGSGDCATRTSDVVSTAATITPSLTGTYGVSIDVPLMSGDAWTVRFTLDASAGGLRGMAAEQGVQLQFIEVDTVDPDFAPIS
jgi:hypothetical protein